MFVATPHQKKYAWKSKASPFSQIGDDAASL